MVCLGNICRSPLAEGILKDKLDARGLDWDVDSAGTGAWHIGHKPDERSILVARENDIDISHQRARQFTRKDFDKFDWIIPMDRENLNHIWQIDPDKKEKVKLMLDFLYPGENRSVPDPYFGGQNGFYEVYQLLDKACDALIEKLVLISPSI